MGGHLENGFISMNFSLMSLLCPMDHFETMIGNNNQGVKRWWEVSFQRITYETTYTHLCCISFVQTCLYSFTWCFYNYSNYTCLGCIYASWKCMNIHRLYMAFFPYRYMRLWLGQMNVSNLNQIFLWCGGLVHPQLLCTHLKLK